MSITLGRSSDLRRAPLGDLDFARSAMAAVIFPLDRLISGMVAAGQGVDAICVLLGLSRDTLVDCIVRLGLRNPHDHPMRKPGARGWSVLDTMRLIAWRMAGVHPDIIGLRLGRSANGVRAKARRLGLPVPNRKLLQRPDPATLADPETCARVAPSTVAADPPGMGCPISASTFDLTSVARTNPASPRSSLASAAPLPTEFGDHTASADTKSTQSTTSLPEREPRAGLARSKLAKPSLAVDVADAEPRLPEPAPELTSRSDIAWVGACRRVETNEVAIMALSMRYFGGQNWKHIAVDAGMTPAALRSVLSRIGLPRDPDRKKFGPTHDPESARATLEKSGFRLERDNSNADLDPSRRPLFWKHKRDRGVTTNRATRFRRGQLGEYDKYKSEPITLVTRAELQAPRFDFSHIETQPLRGHPAFQAPFAPSRPILHP